uniref:Uncharacterized protein n=1 Tax=Salmo trutta TaxID=8032 RepID=A0A673Z8X8_SALTR
MTNYVCVTVVSLPLHSGESFERQASFRRALANTDSLIRHPRNKLTRRKTITGIPDDVPRELGKDISNVILWLNTILQRCANVKIVPWRTHQ